MKKTKLQKKLLKTNKALQTFIQQTFKNFNTMKKKIKVIWACFALMFICMVTCSSCNVTRMITNQSEYYQKGDTSVVIQTKTIETYDATKKGF